MDNIHDALFISIEMISLVVKGEFRPIVTSALKVICYGNIDVLIVTFRMVMSRPRVHNVWDGERVRALCIIQA